MMVMHSTPIRRIFDMPGHKHYGPARRIWVMLEQLFADRGGVAAFDTALSAYRSQRELPHLTWDQHLSRLIDGGLGESAAQRIVMQQMLIAEEWIR